MNDMNKHRHLPLTFGFLMMAASTAAGQIKPPADQVNAKELAAL